MDFDWTELMAADVEVLPRFRRRVEERDAAGLCLNIFKLADGSRVDCGCKARTRGLCNNCHYAFRMEKKETPKTKRRLYENNRIRQGTLMPDRQGKRIHKQTRQHAKAS